MASRKRRSAAPEFSFDWVLLPLEWLKSAWEEVRKDNWARAFLVVFALAALFRLWQPDWYHQRQFHPDERWLFQKTAELSYPDEPGRVSGDPAGLQYGSLPLYILATLKDMAKAMNPRLDVFGFVVPAGRALSGIFDTLSVLLVFLLGSRLWNRRVGLLAAAFLAFTPVHIQLAHFFTVDPLLTLLCLATLLACAQLMQKGTWTWSILSGVFFGAALASKTAALPLAAPIILAHGFAWWDARQSGKRGQAESIVYGLGMSVVCAGLAFFACMPWAVLDMEKFLRNQHEQQNILVTGSPDGTPFVRQYWDTAPIFFHLKNIFLYYQGIFLGGLCLAAFGWHLYKGVKGVGQSVLQAAQAQGSPKKKKREAGVACFCRQSLLILSWALPYLLVVGFAFAKFARYMLPLIPFLCLLGAASAVDAWERFEKQRQLIKAAVLFILITSLAYSAGYFNTYLHPHPWIAASQWMFDHVPPQQPDGRQTTILNETWGDDLPVEVNGRNAGFYHNWQINIVEWDSPAKLQEFGTKLSQSDYLILADPRAYGTYLRLPKRFPLTYAYYQLLFTQPERLGFERAYDGKNQANMLGIRIDDSRTLDKPSLLWADESYTLYDHPRTLIFRKTKALSAQEIQTVLSQHVSELRLPDGWTHGASPEENLRQAMGMAPVNLEASQNPEQVNPNFGLSRGAMLSLGQPVITWWVLMVVLGLLAMPLCQKIFFNYMDGGYALAKALGLLLFAWLAFWLVAVHAMYFYQGWLWVLLGLCVAGWLVWALPRQAELKAWWKRESKEILWAEGLFAAAFLFYCTVKAFNPNIHDIAGQGYNGGGEPLGMTYLSALTRCATFPAFDPWLALSSSSYYYFGYLVAGTLTKLSGFPPSITYNLSLSLFFALLVVTAYGVGLGLTSRRRFALLCAGAIACFGSLWTVPYLVNKAMAYGQGLFGTLGQMLTQLFSWNFIWDPTRFPELVNGHIFEFPYFSYIYSDLHPHNMVLPFSLVLLGLLLVPFKSTLTGWKAFGKDGWSFGLFVFLYALFVDAQYCMNTWNWPVALALGLVALPLAGWAGRSGNILEKAKAAGMGLGLWAGSALLGMGLMWPFRAHFARGVTQVGKVSPAEWQMGSYIPVAFFAFGMLGLLSLAPLRLRHWAWAHQKALGLKRLLRMKLEKRVPRLAELLCQKLPVRAGLLGLFVLLAVLFKLLAFLGLGHGGVFWLALGSALFCLAGLGLLLDSKERSGEEAFIWVLGFAAMAMVAGCELYYVADRMNTIFKFWMQAWVLMGLAFGYGAFRAFEWMKEREAAQKPRRKSRHGEAMLAGVTALFVLGVFLAAWGDYYQMGSNLRMVFSFCWLTLCFYAGWVAWVFPSAWSRRAWAGVICGLALLGLLYPFGATVARINSCSGWRNPHLDGLAFMDTMNVRSMAYDNADYDQHDAGAIHWLNEHADKTETILEAPGREMYKGYSRYSIYTGLPTLVGWKYQVGQQLGVNAGSRIEDRDQDASTIYNTPQVETAKSLLKKYRVRWIAVGPIERKLFPADGLAKFSQFCSVAYQNEGAVLYEFKE